MKIEHRVSVNDQQPFPGLRSFSERNQSFFYGRSKEVERLLRLVKRDTSTVLFGRSGLGKTSLLQAGLYPRLRSSGFLPIPVRIYFDRNAKTASDQIKTVITEQIKAYDIDAPPPGAEETLWEYFHSTRIWDQRNHLLTPVIVFDQFEELFTLGMNDTRASQLLDILEELVENRIPPSVRKRLDRGEELPFAYNKPTYRVVLSLREDFLPHFEELMPRMPSLMHQRMRLTWMNGDQALEAILRPASHLIDEDSAKRVVAFVAASKLESDVEATSHLDTLEVEPALLALTCFELNRKRLTRGLDKIDTHLLDSARKEILSDFYERCVHTQSPEVRAFIEDRLLTSSGYRGTLSLDDALRLPGISKAAIDSLVSQRLLRVEMRLGLPHLELTHDVLTDAVLQSRERRHSELEHDRDRRRRRRHTVRLLTWVSFAFISVLAIILVDGAKDRKHLNKLTHERKIAAEAISNWVLEAKTSDTANILQYGGDQSSVIVNILRDTISSGLDSRRELRARWALFLEDPGRLDNFIDFLHDSNLEAEAIFVARRLSHHLLAPADSLISSLWQRLESPLPGNPGPPAALPYTNTAYSVAEATPNPRLMTAIILATCTLPRDSTTAALSGVACKEQWHQYSALIAARLVDQIRTNMSTLQELTEVFQPASTYLLAPLGRLFRSRSEPVRDAASRVVALLGEHDTALLIELLKDADPQQYDIVMPRLRNHATEAAGALTSLFEADRTYGPEYNAELSAVFEAASGMLHEHFAYCNTMGFSEFLRIAETIRPFGYRPVRCRPYNESGEIRVAAVWRRDFISWWLGHGLSPECLANTDAAWKSCGYSPVDVAGYMPEGEDGESPPRYVAIWASTSEAPVDHTILITDADRFDIDLSNLSSNRYELITLADFADNDRRRYTGVMQKRTGSIETTTAHLWQPPAEVAAMDDIPLDICVPAVLSFDPNIKWSRNQAEQNMLLQEHPDDTSALSAWAAASYNLGQYDIVIDRLTAHIESGAATTAGIYYWRACSYARAGQCQEAELDALSYADLAPNIEDGQMYTAGISTICRTYGGASDSSLQNIDPFDHIGNSRFLYNLSCMYSVASAATERGDMSRSLKRQAIDILRLAVEAGWSHSDHLHIDSDIDPLRGEADFKTIRDVLNSKYHIVSNLAGDGPEATIVLASTLSPQDAQTKQLVADLYFPTSISSKWDHNSDTLKTASIWHKVGLSQKGNLRELVDLNLLAQRINAFSLLRAFSRIDELLELSENEDSDNGLFVYTGSVSDVRRRMTSIQHAAQTDTSAARLPEDVSSLLELGRMKVNDLSWGRATETARKWWTMFEGENSERPELVKKLADQLKKRGASISDFFLAYVFSNSDNIQANLHYIDFSRCKQLFSSALDDQEQTPDPYRAFLERPHNFYSSSTPTDGGQTLEVRELLSEVSGQPGWIDASDQAQAYWSILLEESSDRPEVTLELARALAGEHVDMDEFLVAVAYSGTRDLLGVLHYLDFMRLRDQADPPPTQGREREVYEALKAFSISRVLGTLPPEFPVPAMGSPIDSLAQEDQVESMCTALKSFRGEVDVELVRYIIGQYSHEIEHALVYAPEVDLPEISLRLSRAAKYRVHEKEIAFYILLSMPFMDSFPEVAQGRLSEIWDQAIEKYGRGLEHAAGRMFRRLNDPEPIFNMASTHEDLTSLFLKLHQVCAARDIKAAKSILMRLQPNESRLRRALEDNVPRSTVDMILSGISELPARSGQFYSRQMIPNTLVTVSISEVTKEQLINSITTDGAFGGKLTDAILSLRPELSFYNVKLVDGVDEDQIEMYMIYWDDKEWTCLGPTWHGASK